MATDNKAFENPIKFNPMDGLTKATTEKYKPTKSEAFTFEQGYCNQCNKKKRCEILPSMNIRTINDDKYPKYIVKGIRIISGIEVILPHCLAFTPIVEKKIKQTDQDEITLNIFDNGD